MKNIIKIILPIFLFSFLNSINAQVNGNGKIVTREFTVKDFKNLLVNFPANLVIDCSKEYSLKITTDENIFKCIGIKNTSGNLSITQEKWLEASNGVQIKIGVEGLEMLETGGYGQTLVKNISGKNFNLLNPVGNVTLTGTVENFSFKTHKGEIDATKLLTTNIDAKITGRGLAELGDFKTIVSTVDEDGNITTKGSPFDGVDNKNEVAEAPNNQLKRTTPKYIDIKVSNNSFQRLHTVVQGPTNRRFSYGLPFFPYQKRKERWPVGTQLFKENPDGTRILLTTIGAEDEGKVVEVFR